jgi:hypothetical protein
LINNCSLKIKFAYGCNWVVCTNCTSSDGGIPPQRSRDFARSEVIPWDDQKDHHGSSQAQGTFPYLTAIPSSATNSKMSDLSVALHEVGRRNLFLAKRVVSSEGYHFGLLTDTIHPRVHLCLSVLPGSAPTPKRKSVRWELSSLTASWNRRSSWTSAFGSLSNNNFKILKILSQLTTLIFLNFMNLNKI